MFSVAAVAAPAHAMLNISNHATQNMDCAEGLCTPTAADATLNVNDLVGMLRAGDLKIVANEPAVNIKITAPFTWTNKSRLTMSAAQSVIVAAAVVAAGRGAMEVDTNTSGVGGDFTFFTGGSVSFWNLKSGLTINGVKYTLVDDIRILADDIATNPSGNYAFAKNYDASPAGTFAQSPIPTPFGGKLEGLGNAVQNLSIVSRASNPQLGLFTQLNAGGEISDFHLTNVSIQATTSSGNIGGIAEDNGGSINAVSVQGSMFGSNAAGGIVATNRGRILNAMSDISITNVYAGAGVAVTNIRSLTDCHVTGLVSAIAEAAGVAADSQGTVINSSSTASVSITYIAGIAGGLVAVLNDGSIHESFATGSVTDQNSFPSERSKKSPGFLLGGLVGASSASRIQNSYSAGRVTGVFTGSGHNSEVGGLVGQNWYSLTDQTYSIGAVTLNRGYLGGLLGYDQTTKKNNRQSYWDLSTSNVSDPSRGAGNITYDPGIKGLSDSALHQLPKGFSRSVWAVDPKINHGYPYLIANPPSN